MTTRAPVTISRPAFFGGLLLGIAIIASGFYGLPLLGLPEWASSLLELAIMAAAMGTTIGIWRKSSRAAELDTSTGDRDGDETVRSPPT